MQHVKWKWSICAKYILGEKIEYRLCFSILNMNRAMPENDRNQLQWVRTAVYIE